MFLIFVYFVIFIFVFNCINYINIKKIENFNSLSSLLSLIQGVFPKQTYKFLHSNTITLSDQYLLKMSSVSSSSIRIDELRARVRAFEPEFDMSGNEDGGTWTTATNLTYRFLVVGNSSPERIAYNNIRRYFRDADLIQIQMRSEVKTQKATSNNCNCTKQCNCGSDSDSESDSDSDSDNKTYTYSWVKLARSSQLLPFITTVSFSDLSSKIYVLDEENEEVSYTNTKNSDSDSDNDSGKDDSGYNSD